MSVDALLADCPSSTWTDQQDLLRLAARAMVDRYMPIGDAAAVAQRAAPLLDSAPASDLHPRVGLMTVARQAEWCGACVACLAGGGMLDERALASLSDALIQRLVEQVAAVFAHQEPGNERPPGRAAPTKAAEWLVLVRQAWLRQQLPVSIRCADGSTVHAVHPEDRPALLMLDDLQQRPSRHMVAHLGLGALALGRSIAELSGDDRVGPARREVLLPTFAIMYLALAQSVGFITAAMVTRVLKTIAADAHVEKTASPDRVPASQRRARHSRQRWDGPVLHLKIVLMHVRPLVVREVAVPAALDLVGLHRVVQAAFGWSDSHLWEISTVGRGGIRWGDADDVDQGTVDEAADGVSIADALAAGDGTLIYTYDFGDDWRHQITLRRELVEDPANPAPFLIKALRACPPEDCGGPPGFAALLAPRRRSGSAQPDEDADWLDADFDPAEPHAQAHDDALRGLRPVGARRKPSRR
ncbi:MAG: plasmid pRiA4b ORF-3 family protein [Planctomycetes bacterium]|nr:plasmid pRiA4b ORF-3 family protein [Planctomycetota bacterium]